MSAILPISYYWDDEMPEEFSLTRNGTLLMSINVQELMNILKCPIRLELPFGEIHSCSGGHHICESCKVMESSCRTCQAPLTGPRNLALETVMGIFFEMKCKNQPCPAILKGAEKIKEHLLQCQYRPMQCFETSNLISCNGGLVKIEEFEGHLQNVHNLKRINSRWSSFLREHFMIPVYIKGGLNTNGKCPLNYFRYNGNVFLFNVQFGDYNGDKRLYVWVSLLGPKIEAERYSCSISLSRKKHPHIGIKITTVGTSHHNTFEDVVKDGNCLDLSMKCLKLYGNEIGDQEYSFFSLVTLCKIEDSPEDESHKSVGPIW